MLVVRAQASAASPRPCVARQGTIASTAADKVSRRSALLSGLSLLGAAVAPAQALAYGGQKQLASMDAGATNPRYEALQKIIQARKEGREPEDGLMEPKKEEPKKKAMRKSFT